MFQQSKLVVTGFHENWFFACNYGPKETRDRLEADGRAKGMSIFARIGHAAEAMEIGLSLCRGRESGSHLSVGAARSKIAQEGGADF